MENNKNFMRIGVETFISALPDTEKEIKILLNHINTFNKSGQIFRFDLVGNKYVMSILKELESENKINIENMVKNRECLRKALDTVSFTSDNVDFFINLVWAQIEDSNYPETNLKEDFDKACNLEDEDLFDCGASFYVSNRKISLSDNVDINQLKKVKNLKKDMDDETFIFEYGSLNEFKLIFKQDIDEFKNSEDIEKISNTFTEISREEGEGASSNVKYIEAISNMFTEFLNEAEGDSSSNAGFEDYLNVASLIDDDKFEKFSDELEEQSQKEYSLFDDMFQYLEKTLEELNKLNDAFEEENKLESADFDYHSKHPDRAPKIINNSSKIFNKLSNDYEQDREENRDFRSKSLVMLLSLSKIDEEGSEEVLEFFAQCKMFIEELSAVIENYVTMYIKMTDIFPVTNEDDYGKSVNIILKEYDRILDNLKFIQAEINDLNKKLTL